MVGVSRENVNRALGTLRASGAVRRERGRYVLVAEDRLRRQVVDGVGPVGQRRDRRSDGDSSGYGGSPPGCDAATQRDVGGAVILSREEGPRRIRWPAHPGDCEGF